LRRAQDVGQQHQEGGAGVKQHRAYPEAVAPRGRLHTEQDPDGEEDADGEGDRGENEARHREVGDQEEAEQQRSEEHGPGYSDGALGGERRPSDGLADDSCGAARET